MSESAFLGDLSLYDFPSHAPAPSGELPLTETMLWDRPSAGLFGWTQNAGMGWAPQALAGGDYLILSTHGGVRAPDGTPVALGYHTNEAGGGDFYDRVYLADRPEVSFKANPHRVVGTGAGVRIRGDSKWNVPEPELTLLVSPKGRITGYTVGNDMSSRDIEGENPPYLPQAKVYDKCCALGPPILVTDEPPKPETEIRVRISSGGTLVVEDATTLAAMKRKLEELVEYLYREASFPNGALLQTGTGVLPPDSFSLAPGDQVEISGIGTLSNSVERKRGLES